MSSAVGGERLAQAPLEAAQRLEEDRAPEQVDVVREVQVALVVGQHEVGLGDDPDAAPVAVHDGHARELVGAQRRDDLLDRRVGADGHRLQRKAADDAAEVELFDMDEMNYLDLAFDHRGIIADALWFIRKDMSITTLAKNFLDEEFVLSELQGVLLTVLDEPWIKLDAQFFRKAPLLPFIEKVFVNGEPKKTNRWSKGNAQLYCFNDYEPFVSIYHAKY